MSGDHLVSLVPIDDSNRDAVLALSVTSEQQRFVSSVAESLEEAADEPGRRAISWAVYSGSTPVGSVMIGEDEARRCRALSLEAVDRPAKSASRIRNGCSISSRNTSADEGSR